MFGFFEAIYSFLMRQIGNRTDAANSSGSLHAKASDIIADVGTANTNINSIKTNVGSNADAASASGSVHGKLKELRTQVLSRGDKAFVGTSKSTSVYGMTGSYQRLSITGKGYLKNIVNQEASAIGIQIVIDGVRITNDPTNSNVASFFLDTAQTMSLDMRFESSLTIYATINYGLSILYTLD